MINRVVKFAIVGGIGFIVDASIFALSFYLLDLPIYSSRVIAFVCAATSTWLGNRLLTFSDRSQDPKLKQWLRFMMSATLSAIPNFVVFALISAWLGSEGVSAMVALVCGVLVGMISNYTLSSKWVFKTG
jgi:putative flippase GtrA